MIYPGIIPRWVAHSVLIAAGLAIAAEARESILLDDFETSTMTPESSQTTNSAIVDDVSVRVNQ